MLDVLKKLRVGIYGLGHQVSDFINHDRVDFVAYSGVDEATISRVYKKCVQNNPKKFDTLDEMLEHSELDLICLRSPRRDEQVQDAIKILKAKIHVCAEKPSALTEDELDRILDVENESGVEFHEMADTAFYEPYTSMKSLIDKGAIGEIVQIYAQKSYPALLETRPEDPIVDGGITRQAGIHAARFIEHVCGVRIKDVKAFETNKGAPPKKQGLVMASSVAMTLENGGVASACINYCNPKDSFGLWGNECIRAFGTSGVIEITDGGRRTHLWNQDGDLGEFSSMDEKTKLYFEFLVDHLLDGSQMPFDSETELHPLRAVIRMKESV